MMAMFHSWWQQIQHHRVGIGVIGTIFVVAIALIIAGYWFYWTGFNGYYQVTTARTISGPSAGTVVRTEVYQPGKVLWDWMQLLIIPVALTFGVWWLNRLQQQRDQRLADQRAKTEREAAEKHAQTEREIALDNQHEAALQSYIDSMSELLLEKNLRKSGKDDEVRKIARVRTLTVLPRLDGKRKASVLQFLHESGLIEKDESIINLEGADPKEADIRDARLNDADLSYTDLSGADLRSAFLVRSNLRGAIFNRTNLSGVFLGDADLRGADLIDANLHDADLSHVNLTDAGVNGSDLRGANLSNAILVNAGLAQANLSFANISFAALGYTNFQNANLRGANLSVANLIGAELKNADLSCADLNDAKVTDEQLKQAKSLEGATMPDGTKHA